MDSWMDGEINIEKFTGNTGSLEIRENNTEDFLHIDFETAKLLPIN